MLNSRPNGVSTFEFVILAGQRAAQLMRGCVPRIADTAHKVTTIALAEVAAGKVERRPEIPAEVVPAVV
jgi:DNA-directed RNA polymerase omega subunit